MGDSRNDSVSFSGSTFHGPVSAGANSQAIQYQSGVPGTSGDDLRTRLAAVRELIKERADELADADGALRDVDDVEAEVRRGEPDVPRLRDALSRLGRRVATVATVATAVYHIQEMVREAMS
jgi:hypothetical protein